MSNAPPNALANTPLRIALDASDSAIVITHSDLRLAYVNKGFTRLFGYTAEEMIGRPLHTALRRATAGADLDEAVLHALRTDGRFYSDMLLYSKTGQPRWVSLVINACDAVLGGPGGSISVLTDITLTKMHEVLHSHILEGMVKELPLPALMDLVCREFERIAPEVAVSILAVDALGQLRPLAAPSLPVAISQAIDGVPIGPCVGSCGTAAFLNTSVVVTDIATDPLWADFRSLVSPYGLHACWSSPIRNYQGKVVGTFALYYRAARAPDPLHQQLVDVCLQMCALAMERHASKERIHQLAFFDVLTGVPNRTMFHTSAAQVLADLQGSECPGALLFINLDRFKQVNNTQGHAAGDALLREVAKRLTKCLRARDVIGRLSGDEFVLLLSDCTSQQAAQAAQRMLDALAQPADIAGQTYTPHASIGVSLFPDDGDCIDTLLRHANQAMTQAKIDQRHSLQLFSAEMNHSVQQRAALEHALQQALAHQQITLHYQPQVLSNSPHTLHGVEVLMRWNHPDWGMVPPSKFIPVAEESGLIHPLTLWLLDEACRQLVAWRKAGLVVPCLAINLSGRSFHRPELTREIKDALIRHRLRPADLVLEITESIMMDARPTTRTNIDTLHFDGFRVSLDDFGTGYSSLSYLHRLPIHELKLDISFVRDLTTSPSARALTLSVLSIAQTLGMVVVAEGVETTGQYEWLQMHGCTSIQGYLFCKPLAADVFEVWLRTQLLDQAPASDAQG